MKIIIAIILISLAGSMWALFAASSLQREKWEDDEQEAWIREWVKNHKGRK